MVFSKEFFKISANSILESVIALSIISICLYIAIMVYATVFTPKTSSNFYFSRNYVVSLYYESQVNPDSIDLISNKNIVITREWINSNLEKVNFEYKDSSNVSIKQNVYLQK
ncbi:hypothetical protein [Flavobacterium capsici]|uniref:Uncharacterized protein n=1 Tax=Flavobacterium capsici TaxID=3075618 RepID=A0AA96EYS6_9FLAO|nr:MULTISPECIES: hypothetical protein [unclassified Flavobacterium]WNM19465.1 hypothetical protein RN608_02000 [Flavobacterium sp. PMR2A8]WNM20854.1 hypothetical protein RN605_09170 [Flavobacterium sp. PMTSA4]